MVKLLKKSARVEEAELSPVNIEDIHTFNLRSVSAHTRVPIYVQKASKRERERERERLGFVLAYGSRKCGKGSRKKAIGRHETSKAAVKAKGEACVRLLVLSCSPFSKTRCFRAENLSFLIIEKVKKASHF